MKYKKNLPLAIRQQAAFKDDTSINIPKLKNRFLRHNLLKTSFYNDNLIKLHFTFTVLNFNICLRSVKTCGNSCPF